MASDVTSSIDRAEYWRLDRGGPLATLWFINPPRNFLTFAAFAELEAALSELGGDETVHVVVLRSGLPNYFAAHADLDELALLQEGPVPEARSWYSAMRTIERLPQPVVAVVSGQVWGGGLELALACDIRVALPDAHFRLPETSLGIIPGAGGTQRLMRLAGVGRAADLVLSGRLIGADEAVDVGLVERALGAQAADAYVANIAAKPRASLVATKRALRDGQEAGLSDGLRLEGQLFAGLLAQSASKELIARARAAYAAAHDSEAIDVVTAAGRVLD